MPATWGRAFSFGPIAASTDPLPPKDFSALKAAHEKVVGNLSRTVRCEVDLRYDPAVGFVKAAEDSAHSAAEFDADSKDERAGAFGAALQCAGGGDGARHAVLPAFSLVDSEEETKATPPEPAGVETDTDNESRKAGEDDGDVSDDELRVRALMVPVDVPDGERFLPDDGCRLSLRLGSVLAGHERGLNTCLSEGCACEGVFYKEFNCLKSHLLAVVSLDIAKGAPRAGVGAAWKYLRANQPELGISYNERLTEVVVSEAVWVPTPTRGARAGEWHIKFRPTVDTDRLNALCWARACVGANVVDSGVFEIRTKPSCWLVFEGVPRGWTAEQFEAAVRETDARGALVSTTLVGGDCSASGALGFAKYTDRVRAGEACFAFLDSAHAAEQAGSGMTVSLVRSINRQFKRGKSGQVEVTGIRHPDECQRGIVYAQVQVRRTPLAMERRRAARRLVLPRQPARARAVKRGAGAGADSDAESDEDCEIPSGKRMRRVWDLEDPEFAAAPAPTLPVAVGPRAMLRPLHLARTGEAAAWEEFSEDAAPFGGDHREFLDGAAAQAGGLSGGDDDGDVMSAPAADLAAALRAAARPAGVVLPTAAGRDHDMNGVETESETAPSPTVSEGSLTGASHSSAELDYPPVEFSALMRATSGASGCSVVPGSFVAVMKARSVDLRRAGSMSAAFAKDLDALLDDPRVNLGMRA